MHLVLIGAESEIGHGKERRTQNGLKLHLDEWQSNLYMEIRPDPSLIAEIELGENKEKNPAKCELKGPDSRS